MTLSQRIGRAGQGIGPGWDEGDVDRVWQGLRRKRRRRAAAAGAGLLSAVGLVVAGAFAFRSGGGLVGIEGDVRPPERAGRPAAEARPAERPPPAASTSERPVRLADGSTAAPWGAGAEPGSLVIREDGPRRVLVELARGGARFDVVRRPRRVFSVRAGEVTVSVLGTAFSVERVADRVGVVVTRGAVLVDWRVGSRRLDAGEEGWFPPLVVAARSAGAPAAPAPAPSHTRRNRHAGVRAESAGASGGPRGREIARSEPQPGTDTAIVAPVADVPSEARAGAPASEARPLIEAEHPEARPESRRAVASETRSTSGVAAPPAVDREEVSAGTLLAAADRARLAGRFEEGAALLRRLVRDYPADQRAPLAAFSLGRLLLGELGRPAEAARAFARARALAPDGPLAEDALAREVEAWVRAKEHDRARARAAEYFRAYPGGRRAADVDDSIDRATAGARP